MNQRDRAFAAMLGQPVDRVQFIGRMDLWYSYHRNLNTLPHPYERAGLWELQRDLGIGNRFILGFGDNVPTDALFARIKRVAEFWNERGAYPSRTKTP